MLQQFTSRESGCVIIVTSTSKCYNLKTVKWLYTDLIKNIIFLYENAFSVDALLSLGH
jgi:hypothetical protein